MNTLFYQIEPYHIKAMGLPLTIVPMEDGVYRVCHQNKVIADLYPEITAAGVYWNGFGQLSPGMADEIGTQIYACEI